ncbi:MAG: hypothetical protein V8T09_02595 [Oscillospiraceae bacterium]
MDDGYSGANFIAAGKEDLTDMNNGDIAVIITKAGSGSGRNQLHTGLYIEEEIPFQ